MGRAAGIALAAAGLIAGGSAGAASHASCIKPRGYVVKEKTRAAVVFTNRNGYRAYGCLYRRGELVRLSGAVGSYTLAGKYVAYFLRFYELESGPVYRVMVRDLRTGGFRHIEAAYSDLPQQAGPDDGYVASKIRGLVLKRNGSVAWLSCFAKPSGGCPAPAEDVEWEAWRADTRGRKLLDASADVRLRSLRLEGSSLTWRHGTHTRTATLR